MPTSGWTTMAGRGDAADVVVMASRLPLRRHRSIPRSLAATLAVRRQLRHTEGVVGYALDADLVQAVFWTVSAWQSQEALDRFAGSDPHRRLILSIRLLMAPTTFTFWQQPSSEVPVRWDFARTKLSDPSSSRSWG
jgi:hypothetical protein